MITESIRARGGAGGAALVALLLAVTAAAPAAPDRAAATTGSDSTAAESSVLVVEMHDFRFSPSRIEVHPGQVVRFIQASQSPHNVEFRDVPSGTRLGPANAATVSESSVRISGGAPPAIGPFLMGEGSAYEIVIDESFATGIHEFVCTPHEAMGMTGVLVVTEENSPAAASDGERR